MTKTERQIKDKGLKKSTPYGTYESDREQIHTWANDLDISDSMMLEVMIAAGRQDVSIPSMIKHIKMRAAKEGVKAKKIVEAL